VVTAVFSKLALRATKARRIPETLPQSQALTGLVESNTSTIPSMGAGVVSRPYRALMLTMLFEIGTQIAALPLLSGSPQLFIM